MSVRPKPKNEKTGARVARIAGKVLGAFPKNGEVIVLYTNLTYGPGSTSVSVTWSEIRALAASCLTQAPNRLGPAKRRKVPAKRKVIK